MHKYWGKKPSSDLKELIDKYSNQGDTVLDTFLVMVYLVVRLLL